MYDSIYLLQTRECITQNKCIFKIGRTSQDELRRFNCYPRGSKLHLHISCFDGVTVEKNLVHLFNERYTNVIIYGTEYFEGDLCSMMKDILNIIGYNFDSIHNHTKIQDMIHNKDRLITAVKEENNTIKFNYEKLQKKYELLYERQQQIDDNKNNHDLPNICNDDKMVYECENCSYSTINESHYLTHKNKKHPCHNTVNGNINGKYENIMNGQNTVEMKLQCPKCKKDFKSKKRYKQHISKCNGFDVLTCPNCYKVFETRDQKYKHKRNGKCIPINQQNVTINNTINENLTNEKCID